MKAQALRDTYIDFFRDRQHRVFASSSLIPDNDPTLLFTVAGMVQFKPMFAGLVNFDFNRAASVQKCLRVVDIEEVGKSPFHDTFFEMLGNFSFGDYFQEDAILWAWEYLTSVLNIDRERLYVTVHKDDRNAYDIWRKKVDLSADRIIRMGDKTNFWGPAGGTGACGPSSEIFYDFGPGTEDMENCTIENECRRYVEVWNLVFPQFNQDKQGTRHPLKNRGVDTGMGLERLAAVVQNRKSIFETDLFSPIIRSLTDDYNLDYDKYRNEINSISDHIRALTMTIADNVIPENEGRGYVIRRILRRASRLAYKAGMNEPFLYRLSSVVVDLFSTQYPELKSEAAKVSTIIKSEEERFLSTLSSGMEMYAQFRDNASGGILKGDVLFRMYDTFGFPIDLMQQMAEEDGFRTDIAGFEALLEEAREKSRKDAKFSNVHKTDWTVVRDETSLFTGYERIKEEAGLLMYRKDGDVHEMIFDRTPFYAQSGGQKGDTGRVTAEGFSAEIADTYTSAMGNVHRCIISEGSIAENGIYSLEVDRRTRNMTERNHTATHILHSVLKNELGEHVRQEGSYVGPDKLRFDFTHFKALSDEELHDIERRVNEHIFDSHSVETNTMAYDDALGNGATALFTEKYGDTVRVVSVSDFSMELCGGTHVCNTAEIGMFRILHESSVAAGIRRIEAVTSLEFYNASIQDRGIVMNACDIMQCSADNLSARISSMKENVRDMEKKLSQSVKQSIGSIADSLEIEEVNGCSIVVSYISEPYSINELRELMDILKQRHRKIAGFIVTGTDNYPCLCFSSNSSVDAGKAMKEITASAGGRGGGRKEMASGTIPSGADIKAIMKSAGGIVRAYEK